MIRFEGVSKRFGNGTVAVDDLAERAGEAAEAVSTR